MRPKTEQTFEPLPPLVLSPVEAAFWRIEQGGAGTFRIAVRLQVDGSIQADPLQAALQNLQRRHPKLRAWIAPIDGGTFQYRFSPRPAPIPFAIRDCGAGEPPWRDETRKLLEREPPPEGPLAAITVLRTPSAGCSELLLTVHHAIADGLSALVLVDDLLSEYEAAEGSSALDAPTLPPIASRRAEAEGGWRGRLYLLRRFLRLQGEDRRSGQTVLSERGDVPPQSQWSHWIFSREETVRLVRRCRKERASVTAAVVAAVCCGLMDCLSTPIGRFKCQLPFDVRELADGGAGPVSPRDLGCFISIMNAFVEVSKGADFWSVARHASEDLQEFARHGGPAVFYNLAAAAEGRFLARAARSALTPMRPTLLATNYGVPSIRDVYGSLRPRACTLTFKNDGKGPHLIAEALVLGQRLNIGFAADRLEAALWERLEKAVRSRLDQAAAIDDRQVAG